MAKVSKRGGFSDRNRIKPINDEIQLKNFDVRSRTHLQNMISKLFGDVYTGSYWGSDDVQDFFKYVLGEIYSEAVDYGKKYLDSFIFEMINKTLQEDDYDDVLTLIEAIVQYWDSYLREKLESNYYDIYRKTYCRGSIFDKVNCFLQNEYIGYRFLDGQLTPISDDFELGEIAKAIDVPYAPVYDHLSKANKFIADRNAPDYENSIKESISAVEALCEILIGIKGKEATLGRMLKKLEDKGVVIHTGLKAAFDKLYGYTSDANGIRHAGDIGGPSSTFEEAKFMLVSCSAFINYLIAVSAKIYTANESNRSY